MQCVRNWAGKPGHGVLRAQGSCWLCVRPAWQAPHLVQDHAANQLHIKGAQAQHALGGLAHQLHTRGKLLPRTSGRCRSSPLAGSEPPGAQHLAGDPAFGAQAAPMHHSRVPPQFWQRSGPAAVARADARDAVLALAQRLGQHPLPPLTAKASTSSEFRASPLAARAFSAAVSSRSCASVSCCMEGSSALISSTRDWYCLRVRSAGSFLNTLDSPPSRACTGWAPRRAARRAALPPLLLHRRCGAAKGGGRHAAATVLVAVRPVQRCSAAAGAAWHVAATMCGSLLRAPHLTRGVR